MLIGDADIDPIGHADDALTRLVYPAHLDADFLGTGRVLHMHAAVLQLHQALAQGAGNPDQLLAFERQTHIEAVGIIDLDTEPLGAAVEINPQHQQRAQGQTDNQHNIGSGKPLKHAYPIPGICNQVKLDHPAPRAYSAAMFGESRARAISDEIHLIIGTNRNRQPFAGAVLILDEINTLIDTGCGIEVLQQLQVRIDRVINSHSHPDHIGGNWLLQEHGSQLMVPCESIETIGSAEALALRFMGEQNAQLWLDYFLPLTGFKDFTPDHGFKDGEVIDCGRHRIQAIHTPGHLDDHYCFWLEEQKLLLSSDIDLSPFGPWYGSHLSDLKLLKDSLARISKLPFDQLLSCHATRPVPREQALRRMAKFEEQIAIRSDRILNLIKESRGLSLDELTVRSPIYGAQGYDDPVTGFWERDMILHHLSELLAQERIRLADGRYS